MHGVSTLLCEARVLTQTAERRQAASAPEVCVRGCGDHNQLGVLSQKLLQLCVHGHLSQQRRSVLDLILRQRCAAAAAAAAWTPQQGSPPLALTLGLACCAAHR